MKDLILILTASGTRGFQWSVISLYPTIICQNWDHADSHLYPIASAHEAFTRTTQYDLKTTSDPAYAVIRPAWIEPVSIMKKSFSHLILSLQRRLRHSVYLRSSPLASDNKRQRLWMIRFSRRPG